MRYTEISVGDKVLRLRLTAQKLQAFIKNNADSAQSPMLALLDSMNSLGMQAELLTAALNWVDPKDSFRNEIRNGYQLLDEMADNDFGGPLAVKKLILQMAVDAGLITAEDADPLAEALAQGQEKFVEVMGKALRMERVDAPEQAESSREENPT